MHWERICREIEAEPKLTPEQERALWQAWKDGDERARPKLIACSLRFALGPAKAAARPGQRWEPGDLLGEATKALAGCLDRWDGTGCFAAYASSRVRGTIKDFLRRKADVLRTPAGSERALSLDHDSDDEGGSLLDKREAPADFEAGNLPELSKREREVLALTVLASPPGTPEDAAATLGLQLASVDKWLRSALRKSAVAA